MSREQWRLFNPDVKLVYLNFCQWSMENGNVTAFQDKRSLAKLDMSTRCIEQFSNDCRK